ncbi:MAG: DUF5320 domain-containing protein [Desulfohalobiaceae bacterium]|nr:DUF5320 domain-containing protein [Desulfohalobiaceae bacterium]
MPRGNGTGPEGKGPGTGRKKGTCQGKNADRSGQGQGRPGSRKSQGGGDSGGRRRTKDSRH